MKAIKVISLVAILGVAGILLFILNNKNKNDNNTTTTIETSNNITDLITKDITNSKTAVIPIDESTTTTTTSIQNTTSTTTTGITSNPKNSTTKTTKTTTTTKKSSSNISVVSDTTVIPDKYNTGASGNLTIFTIGDNLQGLLVQLSGTNTMSINFLHAQNKKSVVIENYDFTKYEKLQILSNDVPNKITIKFKNCKFTNIYATPAMNDLIQLEFENSTILNFGGSNATFKKCKFGQGTSDAINPYKNVYIYDSYISDIAAYNPDKEVHYDGLQIYGLNNTTDFLAHDLHVYNTRFETPYVAEIRNGIPSKSYVNAPIMVQLEFSDAQDISFENVIANGGGYTVYVNLKQKNSDHTISIRNISFKNVKIGYGHIYDILYPVPKDNIYNLTFDNMSHYDSLYVSSVWKDNQGVHVITTNDTLAPRKLTCQTDLGTYNFNVPAHPKLTKDNAKNYKFSDMPYDIDYTINNTSSKYVKCYDTTINDSLSNSNLIRTQKL